MAVSPDGTAVFVTGYSLGTTSFEDYATVGYNAATGAQLWVSRYNGPDNGVDEASSVAVSPDAKTVFVTGYSYGTTAGEVDYATVAYNAATGAQLWVKRYISPALQGFATSVAASPGGTAVFVTGYSGSQTTGGYDYATVAYNPATGAQLWVKRYNGPAAADHAHSVTVASGKTVFVTGSSFGTGNGYDYATVAYSAATGAQLWVKRYNGAAGGSRGANSVAVSPDGKTVFVTGSSYGGSATDFDYATVAYNAATGAQLWVKRYTGPGSGDDQAYSVAASPDGTAVFVTGYSTGTTAGGWTTPRSAYNATTGAQLWVKRYAGLVAAVSVLRPIRWQSAQAGARCMSLGKAAVTRPMPRWPTLPPPVPSCGSSATPATAPAGAPHRRSPSAPPPGRCSSPGTVPGPSRTMTTPRLPTRVDVQAAGTITPRRAGPVAACSTTASLIFGPDADRKSAVAASSDADPA